MTDMSSGNGTGLFYTRDYLLATYVNILLPYHSPYTITIDYTHCYTHPDRPPNKKFTALGILLRRGDALCLEVTTTGVLGCAMAAFEQICSEGSVLELYTSVLSIIMTSRVIAMAVSMNHEKARRHL